MHELNTLFVGRCTLVKQCILPRKLPYLVSDNGSQTIPDEYFEYAKIQCLCNESCYIISLRQKISLCGSRIILIAHWPGVACTVAAGGRGASSAASTAAAVPFKARARRKNNNFFIIRRTYCLSHCPFHKRVFITYQRLSITHISVIVLSFFSPTLIITTFILIKVHSELRIRKKSSG